MAVGALSYAIQVSNLSTTKQCVCYLRERHCTVHTCTVLYACGPGMCLCACVMCAVGKDHL